MRNHRQSRALKLKTKVSCRRSKNPPGLGRPLPRINPSHHHRRHDTLVRRRERRPRRSNERHETPNASNETSGYHLRRHRRRRRRITRRSTTIRHAFHQGSFASRRPASDPMDTHSRRHRRRDRARDVPTNASDTKKNKIIPTRIASRRIPIARARAPRAINQITKAHIPPSPPREPRSPPRARSSSPACARARVRVVPRT